MSELLLRRSGVRDEARIASLSDAVAELPAGESARRALLTAELAVELTWSVPLEVREQMAWRAVAEARRADDADALAQTLHLLAQVLIGSPHGDSLDDVAAELIDVGGRANIERLELWGRFWRVGALLRSGRHGEADAEIDRIAWALKRHPDASLDRVLSTTRDGLSISRGERVSLASSSGDEVCGLQSLVSAWNGGADSVDPGVAAFAPFAHLVGGRTEDAAGALRAFEREGFQSVPTDHLYPAALVGLAIAAHDTRAVSAAPSLERLLSPFAGSVAFAGTAVSFGPASYALGLLAHLSGRDDDAVRHLRAAIDLDERTEARPHLARAHLALARVLLARRWAGELDEAARLLASARAVAADLGMDGLLDELDALRTQTAVTASDRGAPALLRDRYEPQEMLRSGGQGQIVRALDHQHDRTVALKVRTLREGADRDVLLAEARVLLELTPHAGLPIVRDDFFHDGRYVIVMDWVDGTDLAQVLADRGDPGLPFDTVLGYLAPVADALDHLHRHSPPVVHGDVKPSNLIVTPSGSVVLVDFGIAGADAGAGTPGYRAPEVAAGSPATPASDVYGFAATAFALLTGRPPGGTLPAWDGVEPSIVPALERTIRRGLAIEPERRPGSAGEFVQRLRAVRG